MFATNKNKYNTVKKNKDIQEGICQFPFKFKGQIHNECIDGKEGKWCATEVNDRKYTKKWGFCPNSGNEEIHHQDNNVYTHLNTKPNESILYQSQKNVNHFICIDKEDTNTYIVYYLLSQDLTYIVKHIKKYVRKSSVYKLLKDEFTKNNYIPYGIHKSTSLTKTKSYTLPLLYEATPDEITDYKHFIGIIHKPTHKKTLKQNKKEQFNRKDKIKELKEKCIDPYDGITFEDFDEWNENELKTAILIGPTNAKRCYKLNNIYHWIEQLIQDNKPLKDPINNAHEITKDELNIMKKYKQMELGTHYISPKHKQIVLDEQNVELVISNPNETMLKIPMKYVKHHPYKYNFVYPFYHIQIKINIPSTSNNTHRIKMIHVGYIPAGIEPQQGEDSYLSSYSIIASITKLWDMRKLLIVHHPLNRIKCCTVELNKKPEYWFMTNGNGRIDKDKLSKMGEDLRYQELM